MGTILPGNRRRARAADSTQRARRPVYLAWTRGHGRFFPQASTAWRGRTWPRNRPQTLPFVLFAIPAGVLADRGLQRGRTATLRQTVTPRAMLGRVSAINITGYGARPLGALIGAVVGAVYGPEVCLVVAAVGFLVQALVIVASPVLRLDRQPEMVGPESIA